MQPLSVLCQLLLWCLASNVAAEAAPAQDHRSSSTATSKAATTSAIRLSDKVAKYPVGQTTVTLPLEPSVSSVIFPSAVYGNPIRPSNIPGGKPNLPQSASNGQAQLGLLNAPQFPPFIGAPSGVPKTFPWGGRTAGNTNPYTGAPQTGTVRTYDFNIQRATLAPDGVERSMIVINGQFPGPTIEANWGDTIQITVHNNIADVEEGTAIHWHGLLQTGTPYEDGVPGITQCPIAPGQSFTYTISADLYGTSWYHAHYSAQYAAGLFGAMIIHGPSQVTYDADLGPVLLGDYYHNDYFDILEDVMGTDLTKVAPYSDNNLINGKGSVNCSTVTTGAQCTPNAGYSKFQFTSGKSYRLRLINAGAEAIQKFSIDNHSMKVIAYDFVPINPYTTDIITLGIGQRADVVVTATGQPTDAVWMRSTISTCSLPHQPNAYAMIYYQSADTSSVPTTSAWPDTTNPCGNDDLATTTPYYSITPTSQPATTAQVDINFAVNATGHLVWLMNNSTFRTDYNDPVLYRAQSDPSFAYPAEWNVYNFGSNSSIRIVVENLTPVAHPMHIHGHNMYVLSEGTGPWDGSITNPSNPMRRDVQLIQPADSTTGTPSHIVFQIDADNPGVWPFHCHIAWHVSGGLYINLLESPDEVAKQTTPSAVSGLCQAWGAFTGQGPIDQIDSGL